MEDGPKSPARPTVKRLFALSSNRCAFPKCQTPLVDPETGSIVGEVCHIKGEKPSAPRYDYGQDNQARHGFENLIILCNVHHKVIDDNINDFPVERLVSMKTEHETRQIGKSPLDDSISDKFASAIIHSMGNYNEVVQAVNVSGGQVAHTIINNQSPMEVGDVQIEGKTTISTDQESVGCPYLTLTVVCRSKRPAKIRRAIISIRDHGIIDALEAGFGESIGYSPIPNSDEELTVELFSRQKPDATNGFVLQQDDAARFILPVLAFPVGLFLIRPEKAMALKVTLFDNSEIIVVEGQELKRQLVDLVDLSKKVNCEANFPEVKMNVTIQSLTLPEVWSVGKTNPNPILFGMRVGNPITNNPTSNPQKEETPLPWYERKGNFVDYPEVLQGSLNLCVFASISAAVNYLAGREIWNPIDLFNEHQKSGDGSIDFNVVNTALKPVADFIESYIHNKDHSSIPLSPDLLRDWIDNQGVVILSMELRNDQISQRGGWHMFTLMAHETDRFQVWDTNGLRGFLTDEEIMNGFYYPYDWFYMPHHKEDTLVIKRKKR